MQKMQNSALQVSVFCIDIWLSYAELMPDPHYSIIEEIF